MSQNLIKVVIRYFSDGDCRRHEYHPGTGASSISHDFAETLEKTVSLSQQRSAACITEQERRHHDESQKTTDRQNSVVWGKLSSCAGKAFRHKELVERQTHHFDPRKNLL